MGFLKTQYTLIFSLIKKKKYGEGTHMKVKHLLFSRDSQCLCNRCDPSVLLCTDSKIIKSLCSSYFKWVNAVFPDQNEMERYEEFGEKCVRSVMGGKKRR